MAARIVLPASDLALESAGKLLRNTVVRLRDKQGVERQGSLQEAALWPLWEAQPIREFPSFRGQGHVSGVYYWAKSGRHVGFESRLEESALRRLEFEETVVEAASQPFELRFPDGRRHVPDFFLRLVDGRGAVVDVSTREASDRPRKAASFASTDAVCAAVGWQYRLETEPDPVVQANIDWLASYRRACPEFEQWADVVRNACTDPRPFAEIAALGESPFLIPAIGHLLWRGELGVDLHQPLRETSVIWWRDRKGGGA